MPDLERVLMTTDTVGGVWTYALELSSSLGEFGIEVGLATMGAPASEEQHQLARRVPNLRLFESTHKLEWMQDPWDDVGEAGDWLLGLEARFEPDVIHLNGYVHAALPWTRPRLAVGHSCVLSWWEAVHHEPPPPAWDRYRNEVTRGIRAADLVVAPTVAMLRELERFYGPLRATAVVPNGRDAVLFSPGAKIECVLTAGRLWDPAKNVTTLECIAAQLPWPVYIAGEEKSPDGSAVQFSSLRFLGRLSPGDLAAWYAKASIYALPARYEPFGLTILEAALSGCALLLGDIPSLRENWDGAAVFVPPEDARALRAMLEVLIYDSPRREGLAAQARARAAGFTPQRMAEGYLTAYRKLIRSDKAVA